MALVLTSVVGLLIAQWFKLIQSDWILVSIVIVLIPTHFDISYEFYRGVHRTIGAIIGAMIAIVITNTTNNEWLLSISMLLFTCAYTSLVKIRNYALRYLLATVTVLILSDLRNPSTASITSTARAEDVLIGCSLGLLAAFIIWIVPKMRSNQALRKVG